MAHQTKDRRVQRTENLLRTALISLILEKGYEAITVQDIIDRANVGRSTFYAHFWDKEQLLLSGFERLRQTFEEKHKETLIHQSGQKNTGLEISLVFFQHTGENHQLYKALIGKRGGDLVMKQVQKYLTDLLREHLKALLPDGQHFPVPNEVIVVYLSSAMLGMITWWLDNDLPYTAEQMNRMFYQLAAQPLLDKIAISKDAVALKLISET